MPTEVSTPYSADKAVLEELVDTGNLYDGAILKLLKSAVSLTGNTILADLDAAECDFTGYAASSPIVWGAPFFRPSGVPVVTGDLKTFTVGATPTVLNTVFGWYITNAAGTVYLMGKLFDTAQVLSAEGQAIEVLPCRPAYSLP